MQPTDQTNKTPEVIPPATAVVPAAETAPAPPKKTTDALTYFRGVPPDDKLNRMYGFARAICNAAFISPIVRGDEASVFYLVSMAEDLGAQWTHGLRSIYPMVRRGKDGEGDQIRAGIQGDLALALLLNRKFKVKIKESNDEIATVWMERPDQTMDFEDSFTIGEAIEVGLTKKPNWQYKRDMLRWRAIMRVGRIVAADVLGGMYLPEELESLSFGVSEPTERGPEPPNPYTVGRLSDKVKVDPSVPPGEIHVQKNGETVAKIVNVGLPQETSTQAAPEKGADKPPSSDKQESPAASAAPQDTTSALREELGKALSPSPAEASPVKMENIEAPKTNVVEMPKPSPTLESQPQPPGAAEPKPAAKPTIMTAEQLKKEWTDIAVEFFAAVSPVSVTSSKGPIAEFTRGFFNIGKLPSSSPDYAISLAILRSVLKSYRAQFNKSPQGVGVMAGASWQALKRYVEKWPEDMRNLAYAIAIERYPYAEDSDSGSYLIDYFNDPAHIEMLDESELRMFLVILSKTKRAMLLQDLSVAQSRSMVDIVLEWKIDLQAATEEQILALLSTPPAATAEDPGVPAPAIAAVAETAAEKDDFDDLFGGLEEDEPNAQ